MQVHIICKGSTQIYHSLIFKSFTTFHGFCPSLLWTPPSRPPPYLHPELKTTMSSLGSCQDGGFKSSGKALLSDMIRPLVNQLIQSSSREWLEVILYLNIYFNAHSLLFCCCKSEAASFCLDPLWGPTASFLCNPHPECISTISSLGFLWENFMILAKQCDCQKAVHIFYSIF